MPVGTRNDFANFDLTVNTLISEELERMAAEVFTASNGAIRLLSRNTIGDYERESSFKLGLDIVRDRDDTSVSATEADKVEQRVDIRPVTKRAVKLENTEDSFLTNGYTLEQMQLVMAEQWAQVKPADMLDSALASTIAAMTSNTAAIGTVEAGGITHRALNRSLRSFGDKASSIAAWVMHSQSYFDLFETVLNDTPGRISFQTTDMAIREGSIGTLGKPVVVVDSPALITPGDGAPDQLSVMGLVPNATMVYENAMDNILVDRAAVSNNITRQFVVNSEYALGVKGYGWNIAAGGRNPNRGTLGAAANWEKVATQDKSTAGVLLTHAAL